MLPAQTNFFCAYEMGFYENCIVACINYQQKKSNVCLTDVLALQLVPVFQKFCLSLYEFILVEQLNAKKLLRVSFFSGFIVLFQYLGKRCSATENFRFATSNRKHILTIWPVSSFNKRLFSNGWSPTFSSICQISDILNCLNHLWKQL